jgi:hypothetical protein
MSGEPSSQEVRRKLEASGLVVAKEDRLPNGHGSHLECKTGEVFCVYDSGKVVPRGKNTEAMRKILDSAD